MLVMALLKLLLSNVFWKTGHLALRQ
jgi:hypothetical protein